MTKRLILTRHAKSSWDDPAMSDHDRPLNARGRGAATDLGGWLVSRGYLPGEVLCSDAARTHETWQRIAPTLPQEPSLVMKPALYHAGSEVMLAVLRHATADTVMMIGHNPGIADFARRIVAQPPAHPHFSRYPTGATLVASFEIDDWSQVAFGMGAVRDFIVPREIVA
jgi:phosphohistidine phosphatase